MKLKTHSGTKKRIKKTKHSFMFDKSGRNHLQTNKSKQAKKRSPNGIIVSKANQKRLKKLLPFAA